MEKLSTVYYVIACENGYYCYGSVFTQSIIKARKFKDFKIIAEYASDLENKGYKNVKVHRLGLLNGSVDFHNL